MGKIICLMGKSASGKDTVFKRLLEDEGLGLKSLVPYTTRPRREGERDGVEYFFTDEAGYEELKSRGQIIEERSYHTMLGLWRYFTVADGRLREEENYLVIGTPEAYVRLKGYYGAERMLPVLLELDDGERLQRALDRERAQEEPKYEEMCRRFLADSADFSRENIRAAGIGRRFVNKELERCLQEIREYIRGQINGN